MRHLPLFRLFSLRNQILSPRFSREPPAALGGRLVQKLVKAYREDPRPRSRHWTARSPNTNQPPTPSEKRNDSRSLLIYTTKWCVIEPLFPLSPFSWLIGGVSPPLFLILVFFCVAPVDLTYPGFFRAFLMRFATERLPSILRFLFAETPKPAGFPCLSCRRHVCIFFAGSSCLQFSRPPQKFFPVCLPYFPYTDGKLSRLHPSCALTRCRYRWTPIPPRLAPPHPPFWPLLHILPQGASLRSSEFFLFRIRHSAASQRLIFFRSFLSLPS